MESNFSRYFYTSDGFSSDYICYPTKEFVTNTRKLTPYQIIGISILIGISYQIFKYTIPHAYVALNRSYTFLKQCLTQKNNSNSQINRKVGDQKRIIDGSKDDSKKPEQKEEAFQPQPDAAPDPESESEADPQGDDKTKEPPFSAAAEEEFQPPSNQIYPASLRTQAQVDGSTVVLSPAAAIAEEYEPKAKDYGAKHANLMKMHKLAQQLNIEGVVVPYPYSFDSQTIENFLKKHAKSIFIEWEKIGRQFTQCKDQSLFLNTPNIQSQLRSVDKAIKEAFDMLTYHEENYQALLPDGFEDWLASIEKKGGYLIVRSTGAEDSSQVTNAGGNTSCPYIIPDQKQIALALSEVVRSYFSAHSLQNRINGGTNPFVEKLELAVAVQEMIGEKINGASEPNDIPISLVLFSNELMYVGNEEFRLMRLSATYGYGGSVVENTGIGCDSLFILHSSRKDELYILYDNQPKPERLAPIQYYKEIELTNIRNPASMQNSRALDDKLLKRLFDWALLVEEHLFKGVPVDMEIVIKRTRESDFTIYPVQAREANRPKLLPTYIDEQKLSEYKEDPRNSTTFAEIIIPGKSSVVVVKSQDEILFTHTLAEADAAFRAKRHTIVITVKQKTPEPKNSHPVVNFSGRGISCLAVDSEEGFRSLLSEISENQPLVVDVQTAEMHMWDADAVDPNSCISEGFMQHPANIAVSLPVSTNFPLPKSPLTTPEDVMLLISAVRRAIIQRTVQKALEEGAKTAQDCLQELHDHKWVRLAQTTKQSLDDQLEDLKSCSADIKDRYELITTLDEKIERAFEEAMAVLKNEKNNERLQPLFHLKVIEKLLKNPYETRSINQITMTDVEIVHTQIQSLLDYQQSIDHKPYFSSILTIAEYFLNPEEQKVWADFLAELESLVHFQDISQENMTKFIEMIELMKTAEVLPAWFTFFFPATMQSDPSPINQFNALLTTLPKEDIPLINYLGTLHRDLVDGQRNIELCGNLDSFDQAFTWIQKIAKRTYYKACVDHEDKFLKFVKKCTPVTRILVVSTLQKLVDTFDNSIKAMKASQTIPDLEKVVLFKKMLNPYIDLLDSWSKLIDKEKIPTHISWPLKEYLSKLIEIYAELPDNDIEQLSPSQHFSVAAAVIGSQTNFQRHFPNRLEDLFTTVHQGLLVFLNNLNCGLYSKKMLQLAQLPLELKEILVELEDKHFKEGKYSKLGIEVTENKVIVKYNIPLNNHSSQIWIGYDKQTDQITFKCFFLGDADNRWETCDLLIQFLHIREELELAEPTHVDWQELNFCWKLKDIQSLGTAMTEWEEFNRIATNRTQMIDEVVPFKKRKGMQQPDLVQLLVKIAEERKSSFIIHPSIARILLKENNKQTDIVLLKAAQKGIRDSSTWTRTRSLSLLQHLVQRNIGFEEAIEAIKIGIEDKNQVAWEALVLSNTLLSKGCKNQELSAIAKLGIDKEDAHSGSFDLFVELFKQNIGYKEAIEAVLQNHAHEKPSIRSTVSKLFAKLTEEGYREQLETEATKQGIVLNFAEAAAEAQKAE